MSGDDCVKNPVTVFTEVVESKLSIYALRVNSSIVGDEVDEVFSLQI